MKRTTHLDKDPETLSEYLQQVMDQRALSVRKLAAYVGVASTTVSLWMRGGQPRPETLQVVADKLGLDYAYLMRLAGYPLPDGVETQPGKDSWAQFAAAQVELFDEVMHDLDQVLAEFRERWRKRLQQPRSPEDRFNR